MHHARLRCAGVARGLELNQRIRDVSEGPDRLLYVLTAEAPDGAVLRIEPAG